MAWYIPEGFISPKNVVLRGYTRPCHPLMGAILYQKTMSDIITPTTAQEGDMAGTFLRDSYHPRDSV